MTDTPPPLFPSSSPPPMRPPRAGQPAPSPWRPLALQLAIAALVFGVFGYSAANLPAHPDVEATWDGFETPWLNGYGRWDGGHYAHIAVEGYYFSAETESPIPFFPLYPLMMRGVAQLVGPDVSWNGPWSSISPRGRPAAGDARPLYCDHQAALLAGIGINFACGLLGVFLLLRWTARWLGDDVAVAATTSLSCYPMAYYLCGTVYTEALFLVLALGAFMALERDGVGWLILAAVLGALASATRPVGVALIAGLVIATLERSGVLARRDGATGLLAFVPRLQLGNWRWTDILILGSAAGGFCYWVFLWVHFGEAAGTGPGVYGRACAAPGWGMKPGPQVWLKYEAWKQLSSWPYSGKQLLILMHMGLLAGAFATIPVIIRHMGWGVATYVFAAMFIPGMSSKDFIAMGRYVLPVFPCFAVAGLLLVRFPRPARIAVWVGGVLAMCVLASRFVRWYYVS